MRIEGWEAELYRYLEASRALTFAWGKNDCSLWASDFVDLITGSEHATEWRGRYDTEEGSVALMKARGFANPEAIADAKLEEKPIAFASRGDLVLHSSGGLGICDGRRSYFFTSDRGLVADLTSRCKKAWAV